MADERPFGGIGSLGSLGGIGTLGNTIGGHHNCNNCGSVLGVGDMVCKNCGNNNNVLGVGTGPNCPPFACKCNLCIFAEEGDPVTIGVKGGFIIVGTIAELLCNNTVVRLVPGANVIPPGITAGEPTSQPTYICCEDITFLVKEELDFPEKGNEKP